MARFRTLPQFSPATPTGGRVAVRVFIGEGGVPQRLGLLASSGDPLLDQAALELVRLAVSHSQVPEGMRGIEFALDLAVAFAATPLPDGE
jgi:TonB family protein